MTLERANFAGFFQKLYGGYRPFRWQERLLDELLSAGEWPDRIVAPTGAGKTAVIDVHVFAVALCAGLGRPRLPRRLSMVVGRRVLVDDQYQHAIEVAEKLREARDGIVSEVAAQLRALRRPPDQQGAAEDQRDALIVARLRGGIAPSRDWRDEPTACAVICSTPDMWGSRLLLRGYGTAPRARSREAGLLALDAAVVVDEAHLSRQLLTTAGQVSELVPVADEPLPVPRLNVVETTATPAENGAEVRTIEVVAEDLADEPVLRDRMTKPKPVHLLPTKDWPASTREQRRRVAALMADQVIELLAQAPLASPAAHTLGCYVNTVGMAIDVAQALRSRQTAGGRTPTVVTVCGQSRPADLARLPKKLLSVAGDPEVDVLVTTQSLEVGVDLDLAGVVSELAPGSALAQRVGRANRRGLRPAAPIRVIVPAANLTDRSRSGPYGAEELGKALDWLERRAADPSGLAPWSVRNDPPPPATPRRTLYHRPELGDAWHWARTCDELAAEPQLDLWLAESFDEESSVELAVRDAMPADAADAISLVRAIPPRDDELFTVPLATARSVLAQALKIGGEAADQVLAERPLAIRRRGDEVAVAESEDVRPGDLIVVDSRTAAFTPSITGPDKRFSPPTPVTIDQDTTDAVALATADAADVVALATADDLLHAVPAPGPEQVALRLEAGAWPGVESVPGLLKEYADLPADSTDGARRNKLRELLSNFVTALADHPVEPMIKAAIKLLHRRAQDSDILMHRDAQDRPVRLIVLDRRRAKADERMRQTWLPNDNPVLFDDHREAVALRAAWIGGQVHLPPSLVEVLCLAGRHHDDGKADDRFQFALGKKDELLAKSGGRSHPERGARRVTRSTRRSTSAMGCCWAISSERLSHVDSILTPASYTPVAETSRLSLSTCARSSGRRSPILLSWERSTTASFVSRTSQRSPEARNCARPDVRRSSPRTNAGSAQAFSIRRSGTRSPGESAGATADATIHRVTGLYATDPGSPGAASATSGRCCEPVGQPLP